MAVPDISQDALSAFLEKHFSAVSSNHFAEHFLGPVDETHEGHLPEEDDLGYYPDGAKRTLTDEQIAIFRHSEIESLLRHRRHIEEARDDGSVSDTHASPVVTSLEEGELGNEAKSLKVQDVTSSATAPATESPAKKKGMFGKALSKKQRKAQIAKEKGFFKQNIKPDLRKRTWDKVDAGMDSLMYDDEPSSACGPSQAPQRRRISYDD